MNNDAVIRARINREIKEEAAAVLAGIGLSMSDAVRLLFIKTAQERALPFEPLIPNETTIAAMKAARRGETEPTSGDEILDVLNTDAKKH